MQMTIGQASDATGVKVTTIRFYEGRGLLPAPARTASGRRVYDRRLVNRLKFIKHARTLGFEIDAIAALLDLSDDPSQPCSAADSIAQRQRIAVDQRIAQLQGLRDELTRMISACAGGQVHDCKVIESLADHAHCVHPRHHAP